MQMRQCEPARQCNWLNEGAFGETLGDRFEAARYAQVSLPPISDKWILSSALQKLIRRSRAESAIGVALRLHLVDPTYLRRRLPIIAVEDIGLGGLSVCHDVLTVCSEGKWWREDVNRTVPFLVGAMALAVKSRAACDAFCLADAHGATAELLPKLLAASSIRLIGLACDRELPLIERLNAVRVLGGMSERTGGRYRTISRCDLGALDRVAVGLRSPPIVRWLVACQRKTAGLAAMLPIAVEIEGEREVRQGGNFPGSLEEVSGVPLCGLDMFSDCGRGVLREFFQGTSELREFLRVHVRSAGALRLLQMALFHAESSLLDRYLSSPGLDRLTADVEEAEMRQLGMFDSAHRHALRALLLKEAPRLAELRRFQLGELVGRVGSGAEGVSHG